MKTYLNYQNNILKGGDIRVRKQYFKKVMYIFKTMNTPQ